MSHILSNTATSTILKENTQEKKIIDKMIAIGEEDNLFTTNDSFEDDLDKNFYAQVDVA